MKKQVAIYVTPQELARLKLVEETLEAGSAANALRILINRAYKKILSESVAIVDRVSNSDNKATIPDSRRSQNCER